MNYSVGLPKNVWNLIIWKFEDVQTFINFKCACKRYNEMAMSQDKSMKDKFDALKSYKGTVAIMEEILNKTLDDYLPHGMTIEETPMGIQKVYIETKAKITKALEVYEKLGQRVKCDWGKNLLLL